MGGRARCVRNGEAEFGESEPDVVYTHIYNIIYNVIQKKKKKKKNTICNVRSIMCIHIL
jgi:hypothetical protein